jgi:hypothetical protein
MAKRSGSRRLSSGGGKGKPLRRTKGKAGGGSRRAAGAKKKRKTPPKVGLIPNLPFSIRRLRTTAARAKALVAKAIACPLFKPEVEEVVRAVIQSFHPNRSVTLDKEFQADLGIDGPTRRMYLAPIEQRMQDQGCRLDNTMIKPGDLEACEMVQDVADKVFAARV